MKIVWSPLAVDRVFEIAEYVALDKPSAAADWVDTVFESVKQLNKFPRSGRVVPEIQLDEFREIILDNYRIIYRIEKKQVSILTVRSGREILQIDEVLA